MAGSAQWLPSLRQGRSDWETLLGTLAALYRRGVNVDWKGFDRDYTRRIVTLPGYPFERKRFWFESNTSTCADKSLAARWPAVVAAGSRHADLVPIDLNLHTFTAKYAMLDRLSTAYIVGALRSVGAFVVAGQALRPDDFVSRLGVRPIYRTLMNHWLRRLAAGGLLRHHDGHYIADRPLPEAEPETVLEAVNGLFDDDPVLLRLVRECGPNLHRVLTGAESPLNLLFPGGSSDLADEIYLRGTVALLQRYRRCRGAGLHRCHAARPPGADP